MRETWVPGGRVWPPTRHSALVTRPIPGTLPYSRSDSLMQAVVKGSRARSAVLAARSDTPNTSVNSACIDFLLARL